MRRQYLVPSMTISYQVISYQDISITKKIISLVLRQQTLIALQIPNFQ